MQKRLEDEGSKIVVNHERSRRASAHNVRAQKRPAVSAHSLLPICTSREQALANANTSSSPVNMELVPTMSLESP